MIHNTAIIEKGADLASDIEIGPHVVIGKNVKIHSNVKIEHHVTIEGNTEISNDVEIFPYASIGGSPQDLKYKNEPCFCKIGKKSIIREFVTIHAGTDCGVMTEVGENCLLMAYSHLGHNATIGNNVIIANVGTLAGHVKVDDNVIIGGLVGIHQFVHIGKMAIIGGCAKVVKDIPPFMLADGNPATIRCINKIGLQRNNFSSESIKQIKNSFKTLYKKKLNISSALEAIKNEFDCIEVKEIIDFIENSKRGITRGVR